MHESVSCHPVVYGLLVLSHCQTLIGRMVIFRSWESVLPCRSAFHLSRPVVCLKLRIKSHSYISIVGICLGNAISLCYSVFVFVSYYVHSIGLVSLAFSFVVSLGFSPILSLVLSLILSVLQCLIPAFFSSFYPSSESVYRPPRHVCHLVLSIEFVVLSSHPGSRHCRSRFRICTSRFVSLDSSHQVSSVLGSRFPAFGFVFCYHVPVFCDFVVKSVSHCLCFSSCCCCLVFKSQCLVSWYGCMFCGILYCFGFNWILVWSGHWKAKVCF